MNKHEIPTPDDSSVKDASDATKRMGLVDAWKDLTPKERGTAVKAGAGLLAGAAIVTGVSIASAEHNNTIYENTTKHEQPMPYDFENGPRPPENIEETEVALNPPQTPSPNEIPSPTQRSVDIQLPLPPALDEENAEK